MSQVSLLQSPEDYTDDSVSFPNGNAMYLLHRVEDRSIQTDIVVSHRFSLYF